MSAPQERSSGGVKLRVSEAQNWPLTWVCHVCDCTMFCGWQSSYIG